MEPLALKGRGVSIHGPYTQVTWALPISEIIFYMIMFLKPFYRHLKIGSYLPNHIARWDSEMIVLRSAHKAETLLSVLMITVMCLHFNIHKGDIL